MIREFLTILEEHDELPRISEEIDLKFEVGAINRLAVLKRGPALLFERIKGSPAPVSTFVFGTGSTRPSVRPPSLFLQPSKTNMAVRRSTGELWKRGNNGCKSISFHGGWLWGLKKTRLVHCRDGIHGAAQGDD